MATETKADKPVSVIDKNNLFGENATDGYLVDTSNMDYVYEDRTLGQILQANWDTKLNFREDSLYNDAVKQLSAVLLADRVIKNALIMCEMEQDGEINGVCYKAGETLGTCGFVRIGALQYIRENFNDAFNKYFESIPVRIFLNCTKERREALASDHGTEVQLSEREVFHAYSRQRLMGRGRKEIAVRLQSMLKSLSKDNSRFQENIAKFLAGEPVKIGSEYAKNVATICQSAFTGRLQKFEKMYALGAEVQTLYFDGKDIQKHFDDLMKLTADEVHDFCVEAGKSNEPVTPKAKAWSIKKIGEWASGTQSIYLERISRAFTGDEDAEKALPDVVTEIQRIEKAIKADKDAFWAFISTFEG